MLILVSLAAVSSAPALALTVEQIIVFKDCYTEEGRFVMPVRFEGGNGTVSATLTDEKGNVLDSFKTLQVVIGNMVYYKKAFNTVKSGTYYLNVKFVYDSYYGNNQPVVRKLKITHKQPQPQLAFAKTYQAITESGAVRQLFKFDYYNALGKKIHCEIYDSYGAIYSKISFDPKYATGNITYWWDYYPKNGGLRAENGTYIIKYWVEGQTPMQTQFEVYVGEG